MQKAKFNILDFFVILIVVVAIASVCFKLFDFNKLFHGKLSAKIEYTLEIKGVRDVSVRALKIGDSLMEEDVLIGEIKDIEVKDAEQIVQKADGSYVSVVRPDRFDILLTVKADGFSKEDGIYLFGKRPVSVGSGMTVKTNQITCMGTITQISVDK